MRTTVDILTGFLGSGKTTLLNRLLRERAFRQTAVVVNELGEIGLDHLLISELSDNVALLEGGCLCCAVVDSLPETLLELCRGRAAGELPPFGRIVIETTGLADPGPILRVVQSSPLLSHFLSAGVVVTTVEPEGLARRLAHHPEARRQVALADRIVITKTDLFPDEVAGARAVLADANPLAEIVSDIEIARDPARLVAQPSLSAMRLGLDDAGGAHSHDVQAWSLPVPTAATVAGVAAMARALEHRVGGRLLRCKGVLKAQAGALLVQGVGPRFACERLPALPEGSVPHLTFIAEACTREDFEAVLPWLAVPDGTPPPTREELS